MMDKTAYIKDLMESPKDSVVRFENDYSVVLVAVQLEGGLHESHPTDDLTWSSPAPITGEQLADLMRNYDASVIGREDTPFKPYEIEKVYKSNDTIPDPTGTTVRFFDKSKRKDHLILAIDNVSVCGYLKPMEYDAEDLPLIDEIDTDPRVHDNMCPACMRWWNYHMIEGNV